MSRRLQAALETQRLRARSEVKALRQSLRDHGLFGEGEEVVRARTATGPLDPVWYIAIDRSGTVVDRAWGVAALEVVRA